MAEAQQRPHERAQPAVEHGTREALEQARVLQRELAERWRASTEATLRATFDIQNAAIQSGLSLVETGATAQREALERWAEATRRAQEQVLAAWQAAAQASEEVSERREDAGRGGRRPL
jgi:hypothetical protein